MSDFDNWLEAPYHEGLEEPCDITIMQKYDCVKCGCPFTEKDVSELNYECQLTIEKTFEIEHKICPP